MSRVSHPKDTTTTTNSALDASGVKNLLESLKTIAGPAPALTPKDRARTSKLRKGAEKVIPTLLALSDRIGLSVPEHPTATIRANLDKVTTLAPIHESVVAAENHLGDSIFKARADVWEGATVHYTTLRRLARKNGEIRNSLAPVTEFFARKSPAVVKAEEEKRGHRKGVKEPKGVTTTPAVKEEPAVAQAPAAPTTPDVAAPVVPAPAPAVTPATPAQTPATVTNGAAHS
jgi:hypothetical protein